MVILLPLETHETLLERENRLGNEKENVKQQQQWQQ